jgi:phosphoribosylglycinamide formyltransferase 1
VKIQSIGIITYQYPHLKTEQVLHQLLRKGFRLRIYALPFALRKQRKTLIAHRPDQALAVNSESIALQHQIPYVVCESDLDIDNSCDVYLILGAGILSPAFIEGKRVINCHPGIIPASRGLDSFKWALFEKKPLGITLHYIDEEVDGGEIITVLPTNVYKSDTITTLARRHYENEIYCSSHFYESLDNPQNQFVGIETGEPKRRMPRNTEEELVAQFADYIKLHAE